MQKLRVKNSFNQSAKNYEQNANVQKQVAENLSGYLKLYQDTKLKILDLGAGTGCFYNLSYAQKSWQITELDLAFNMCFLARQNNNQVINGDIENLPFLDGSFDLIYSSLALQWVANLHQAFSEIYRVLNQQGTIYCATFAPETLKELKYCFSEIDQYQHINHFVSDKEIVQELNKAGFKNIEIKLENIIVYYKSVFEIMRSLKAIGASYKESSHYVGKNKFSRIEEIYRHHFAKGDELPVTWQIYYVVAKK